MLTKEQIKNMTMGELVVAVRDRLVPVLGKEEATEFVTLLGTLIEGTAEFTSMIAHIPGAKSTEPFWGETLARYDEGQNHA